MSDDAIQAMREAARLSPENLPLRVGLVDLLLAGGRADEAEAECRSAATKFPDDLKLKARLADAFYRQGKTSQAMVVVEDLAKRGDDAPPRAMVLFARLLAAAGDVERAVRQYKRAVASDPSAADAELADRLGIRPQKRSSSSPSFDSDEEIPGYDPDNANEVVDGRLRAAHATGDGDADGATVERPKVTFADVGGMETLKDEIRMKIIHPLAHADLYKAYGKAIGGGILMYGPPGCGKTHLARATAGEIKASFISIGINDVLDMWIGNSERNLHELFEQARRAKPCVLFFDEVDALAASRTDMRTSAGRHLINQFLAEMDGVTASNDGVLILAATNAPWHVDPAFRRPGRFDRILFVPPPDAPARAGVLRILLKGKPAEAIDADAVARKTDGFSGADLKAVVDVAIEAKLKEAMKAGGLKPLTTKDVMSAAGSVRPSTKEWFGTARNYALYSNQGGTYDDILKYLKM